MTGLNPQHRQRPRHIVRRRHVNPDQSARLRAFDIVGGIVEEHDPRSRYADRLAARYKLDPLAFISDDDLLAGLGRKRGAKPGAQHDHHRRRNQPLVPQ